MGFLARFKILKIKLNKSKIIIKYKIYLKLRV